MRNSLFAFGCLADDPQRVLAAVYGLAPVGIERSLNLGVCPAKLGATAFAHGNGGILFHDPQSTLCHEYSLAPNACANETAPVPRFLWLLSGRLSCLATLGVPK
jgi:hypothetical protein